MTGKRDRKYNWLLQLHISIESVAQNKNKSSETAPGGEIWLCWYIATILNVEIC